MSEKSPSRNKQRTEARIKAVKLRALALAIAALANDEKDKAAAYHLTLAAGAIDEYAESLAGSEWELSS